MTADGTQKKNASKKVVLVMAGHDPSGAAGVQADIESIGAAGCQCVSLITALTTQNTSEFIDVIPQEPDAFRKQSEILLSDIRVHACKIGLTGGLRIAKVITEIITGLKNVPVVLDPILKAGTGKILTDKTLTEFIKQELVRKSLVVTPNIMEARLLTGEDDVTSAGEKMLEWGCSYVLITGADDETPQVKNRLFSRNTAPVLYEWERLPGNYHGSGCTLSATITACLAQGQKPIKAIEAAQDYTWKTLKFGKLIGTAQLHPDRFYQFEHE